MNRTQLIILWIAIAVFVLMGLFPPHTSTKYSRHVDVGSLFVQWSILAVLTGGLLYTLKFKKKD